MPSLNGTFETLDAAGAHSRIESVAFWSENDLFFEGDHWQDGKGLADTLPPPDFFATQTVKSGLARIFTSENHIKECVNRRVNGVISLPPQINVTSPKIQEKANESIGSGGVQGQLKTVPDLEDEGQRIMKIRSALSNWFVEKGMLDVIGEAIENACLHDRAMFRILVPEGVLESLSTSDPVEALDAISVEVLSASQSVTIEDPRTRAKCFIYAFDDEVTTDPVDPNRDDKTNEYVQRAEVSYVDTTTGMTVLKALATGEDDDIAKIPLRGCETMYEIDNLLLITETVRSQQKAVNTTRTHMVHHNKATDFQQRIFLNAQPLGTEILDPDTGDRVLVTEDTTRKPDTDLWLHGTEEETADGVRVKDPSVIIHEPGSVQRFLDSEGQSRRGIYRDCHQLHIELSDDSTSTGQARIQAMADFHQDLKRVKRKTDKAGRWMLKTVWALAEYLAGVETSSDLRFTFSSTVTLGQIDTDSRRALVEENNAGLISRESAMMERGIESPLAEMQILESDPSYRLKRATDIANIIKILTDAGSSLESAAGFAGLSDKQIEDLIQIEGEDETRGLAEPNEPTIPAENLVRQVVNTSAR